MTSLLTGISLGFSAGISPGPLTTLVISTTLERGFMAGLRVAVAPLLTDAPIILLSLWVVSSLNPLAAALLAIIGGLYLIWLAFKTLRSAQSAQLILDAPSTQSRRQDFGRGILVNLLSPNPWLFWLTVGGPLLTDGGNATTWNGLGFLLGFYLLLVGCKIALAWLVAGSRRYLTPLWYRRVLAGSGWLLLIFAGLLLWQGTQGLMTSSL
jgi:threonine/homoserine/homoserine lactone efflux protein